MRCAIKAILAGALAFMAPAWAGDVNITGAVINPLHLSPGTLRALPATTVTIAKSADSDMPPGTFKGVLLTKLLSQAVLKDKQGKHAFLQHTMIVTGRDGYAVALAIGEIEPGMEGKAVILAYDVDGRPFRDGIHLVVPGDKQGARQVRDVVKIEVQ
jgi:hypothetical protein